MIGLDIILEQQKKCTMNTKFKHIFHIFTLKCLCFHGPQFTVLNFFSQVYVAVFTKNNQDSFLLDL